MDGTHGSGNGDCHHDGLVSTITRSSHFTHQKPRRPGATSLAGAPCPGDSGPPATWVAMSSEGASAKGKRRAYPVRETTRTLAASSGSVPGSSRSQPHPPPALVRVPAARAVEHGVQLVGGHAHQRIVVELGRRSARHLHAEPPVSDLDLRYVIQRPLRDRHCVGAMRAHLVRAGLATVLPRQGQPASDALDSDVCGRRARGNPERAQRGAPGQVRPAYPLRVPQHVDNDDRNGKHRGAHMNLHRGQAGICAEATEHVRHAREKRHGDENSEGDAVSPAPRVRPERPAPPDDHRLPRDEHKQRQAGHAVQHGDDPGGRRRPRAKGGPAGAERQGEHDEQRDVGTAPGTTGDPIFTAHSPSVRRQRVDAPSGLAKPPKGRDQNSSSWSRRPLAAVIDCLRVLDCEVTAPGRLPGRTACRSAEERVCWVRTVPRFPHATDPSA